MKLDEVTSAFNKALEKIGKGQEDRTYQEIVKLYQKEKKEDGDAVSIESLVAFLQALGFPYKEYLGCDRDGLIEYLESKLKIDGEPGKSTVINLLRDSVTEGKVESLWKEVKNKNVGITVPTTFDKAQELYTELRKKHCIEFIPQEEGLFDVSSDNTVYYTGELENPQGVDITQTDKLWLKFSEKINKDFFFLISEETFAEGNICVLGSFLSNDQGSDDKGSDVQYYLEAPSQNMRLDYNSSNNAYHLVFANENLTRFYDVRMKICSAPLPQDDHWLCIDFGTSNTTVGTWKDDREIELVKFDDITTESKKLEYLLPSIAYVQDCSNPLSPKLLFGFEAKKRLIDKDYQPKGSLFFNIKQWISADPNYKVSCNDENNHTNQLGAHDIIVMYLQYVFRQAEIKLKRHFVRLHFSAPIKLKARLYDITSQAFKESDGYTVANVEQSLDESIAIVYKRISELRDGYKNKKDTRKNDNILIIDCGGGTTDVAKCRYSFSGSDTGVETTIRVCSLNGQYFGGNELTYRIFQLLKIKLSDYYKSSAQSQKIRIKIDDLISTATDDYLNAVDQYVNQVKNGNDTPFTYYDKLDEASVDAEWVLPTDFANKDIVDGTMMTAQAKRNFNYLWDWAERIKKEFFSKESRATFDFSEDIIQTRKALYFYADPSGERKVNKMNLEKQETVPDVEINIKELTALLSPQIYYILSIMLLKPNITESDAPKFIIDDNEMQNTRILLSGQSCKISLFRDLIKEYIPGIKTRNGKRTERTAEDMKLSCVRGSIQYLMEKELLNGKTEIIVDAPCIIYRVAVKTGSLESEEVLLDGRSITQSGNVKYMSEIKIAKRPFAAGEISYAVYNNIVNSKDAVSTGSVHIETKLDEYVEYDDVSDLLKVISKEAVIGIADYNVHHEGKDESVLSRLRTDLEAVTSDEVGKLLYFTIPNNDGNGFVLWQVVERIEDGRRKYYLSKPNQLDYIKDDVVSRFDGKNCIVRN